MTKAVLELFLESGHQRIAYIGGYQVDMDERGGKTINPDENASVPICISCPITSYKITVRTIWGNWTEEDGERLAEELIQSSDPLPNRTPCRKRSNGNRRLSHNEKHHLAIGKDIMIASFDNIEAASKLTPGLTTVQINAKSIGKAAVRLAVERIDQIRDEPIILTYPTRLVVRESFVTKRL